MPPKTKPCHDCRRRRLRCDASVPFCMKCTIAGRQCLGYSQILRWNDSNSIRGKRRSRQVNSDISTGSWKAASPDGSVSPCTQTTEADEEFPSPCESPETSKGQLRLSLPLLDPSVQDFSYTARFYLAHCKIIIPKQDLSTSL